MKFFIILCISACVKANGVEERCVRLRDCPALFGRFKDQGSSVLRNYQTCGPIKQNFYEQTFECPDVSLECLCKDPMACPDLRPYVLGRNFGLVKSFQQCNVINKTSYYCCPTFQPKKIDQDEIDTKTDVRNLDFEKQDESMKGYFASFQSKCGRSEPELSLRIVGGRLAEVEDHPWLVAIGIKSGRNNDFNVICAGSLITDKHILTAAHCVQNFDLEYFVRLGDTNIKSDDILELRVEEVFIHPGYLQTNAGLKNDIAVLKLSKSVKSQSRIRPICLAQKKGRHEDDVHYGEAEVAGWGTTAKSLSSDDLRVLSQSVISLNNCAQFFNTTRFRPSSTHICAMGNKSLREDSCRGDSGAPLMFHRDDNSYEVIGITSFGSNKCDSSSPTVFARVETFLKWIEFVVTDSVLRDRSRL